VRKPLGGSVAANVLEHGVGALNIDGCRVGVTGGSTQPSGMDRYNARNMELGYRPGAYQQGEVKAPKAGGRYPSHLVLSHASGCRQVGVRKVKKGGGTGVKSTDLSHDAGFLGGSDGGGYATSHYDADGTETVGAWECEPGCPVAELDEQSGVRRSAGDYPSEAQHSEDGVTSFSPEQGPLYSDSGGASRFFYCPKASKADRSAGGNVENKHPTVKAHGLMTYLCRLVTPPGGVVLDPFMGSGSTGVACKTEGFRFIGIEQDADSYETARQRIELAGEPFTDEWGETTSGASHPAVKVDEVESNLIADLFGGSLE